MKPRILYRKSQHALRPEAKAHPSGRVLERPGLVREVSLERPKLRLEGRLVSLVVFDAHGGQAQLGELPQFPAAAEQAAARTIQIDHRRMPGHGLGQHHNAFDLAAALPGRKLNPLERVAGLGPEHGGNQHRQQESGRADESGSGGVHFGCGWERKTAEYTEYAEKGVVRAHSWCI